MLPLLNYCFSLAGGRFWWERPNPTFFPDTFAHGRSRAMMKFNEQDRSGAVTLSAAKGLARWAERCFAEFTLSEAKGSA